MSVRRTFLAVTLLATTFIVAAPAFAQESDTPETDSVVEAPAPAVEIPEEKADDTTTEWSYRFLVPATVVLGTFAVVGTIVMYFVRVTKNRYRIVD